MSKKHKRFAKNTQRDSDTTFQTRKTLSQQQQCWPVAFLSLRSTEGRFGRCARFEADSRKARQGAVPTKGQESRGNVLGLFYDLQTTCLCNRNTKQCSERSLIEPSTNIQNWLFCALSWEIHWFGGSTSDSLSIPWLNLSPPITQNFQKLSHKPWKYVGGT